MELFNKEKGHILKIHNNLIIEPKIDSDISECYYLINNVKDIDVIKNNNNIKNILLNLEYVDNVDIHILYFLNKDLYINLELNLNNIQQILLNPILKGFYNTPVDFELSDYNLKITKFREIENTVCFINVQEIINVLEINLFEISVVELVYNLIKKAWNYFLIYDITNLPINIITKDENIIEFYKELIDKLGINKISHPVNDKTTTFTNSRDVKYIANSTHFFSSNIHQPHHNDYAYYPSELQGDFISLYAIEISEHGGYTSIISNKKLLSILKKYNTPLFEKILDIEITYKYEDKEKGEIIHKKKLLQNDIYINWNYYQIKSSINDKNIMEIREELFLFLEKYISQGKISDITKKWERGDCVIFNDRLVLHERSSFLGSRWLKDYNFSDPDSFHMQL